MKRILCKRCNKRKNETSFYKRADGRVQTWCKDCRAEYRLEQMADPIKYAAQLERERKYRLSHVEETRRKQLAHYHDPNFHEHIAARRREYDREQWKNNPEVRERKKHQKLKSLEKLGNTPEYKYRSRWWKFNFNHRNRIRMYREPFPFEYVSFEMWDRLNKEWTGVCPCCHESGKAMTIDHVIPISIGGYHVDSNLQSLCRGCNTRKRKNETDYRK